jgi:tRNA pseudouridine55 synthase
VMFGVETETLDPEGEVAATAPVPDFATIERVAGGFTGRIEQVPPAYSALHVAGRRAHELARSGRPPEMASRMVSIYSLRLGRYDPPELELEVECSKGTYVRALARDLARAAGSRAHLSALRRTAVGPFRVEEAVTPGGFDPGRHVISAARFMSRLDGVRCQTVDPAAVQAVRYGKPLDGRFIELHDADRILALFEVDERLVAVAERDGPGYRYLAVFPEEPS